MKYRAVLAAALLIGVAVIIAAQFSIPTLFSADGYLHIRMAEVLRQKGLHYDFHWARYSVFAAHFADKDFLYHVLLIPFTFFPNIFFGAKVSAAVFAVLLYLGFFFSLRRYCAQKYLVPVFLLLFLLSAPFLSGLSQPRNMILTITLLFFFVHYAIGRKYWALFIITVLYSLSHVSGPYLLLFVLLAEAVHFANERSFSWECVGMVAFGLIAGILIHPNFPNNLLVFYLNGVMVPIFSLKWGLELGAEFFPLNTRDFVLGYPFILISVILLLIMGASRQKQIRVSTQIWLAIAGFFFLNAFFSQRYLIYAYPMILVALAAYTSDWWQGAPRLVLLQNNKILKNSVYIASILFLALVGLKVYREFLARKQGEFQYNQHYEAVGKWMAQNLPAGELIFHTNWSDSQYLIGLNPKDDYFVTLDPIYMYYWNPKIYNLYRQISFGNSDDPYPLMKNVFGVRYGYAGKNYFSGLIMQIRSDNRFEVLAEDYMGIIFRLRP